MASRRSSKKVVAFSCRSQHTDDMNAMASALIAPRIAPHLPFFDWQAVETFNRIPYRIGAKRALSTQTWSPMPVVQKWVLRQALRGHVPDELLYRAKTTSPSSYKLMEGPLRTFALALLDQWQEPLLESLDSEVRDLVHQTIGDFRSRSVFHRNEDESLLVAIFSLSFVAMLAAACAGADVKKAVAKTLEKTLPARRPQAHMVAS